MDRFENAQQTNQTDLDKKLCSSSTADALYSENAEAKNLIQHKSNTCSYLAILAWK